MLHITIKPVVLFLFVMALAGCDGIWTKTAGIKVESTEESSARQILILIANDGALQIDGEPCDIEALGQRASELSASEGSSSDTHEEPQFNISAEQGADNALVVGVMYELSKVGITNVSIVAGH